MTSEEKLDQLFRDGKINRQEYDRLRNSLAREREKPENQPAKRHFARLPWQIWTVAALLGIEGLGNLAAIPYMPIAAFWLAAKCILIYGLLKGWKWVFVMSLLLTALHALYFAVPAPIVAALNLALFVLLLSAWRFYFPRKCETESV
jgi:hypothetical protein